MGDHRRTGLVCAIVVLLTVALAPASQLAFSYVKDGEPLPPMELAVHGGGVADYRGGDGLEARVFAFIKGDHGRSDQVIRQLRELKESLAGRPVSFALIVSDRHGTGWADTVAAAAGDLPVLIDAGDALYGQLGVALTPSVGIGTVDRNLHVYLPFRKVNFQSVIGAHIAYLLGDIDAAGLDAVLNPSGQAMDTARAGANRKLKLGRMLFERGKLDKARQQTEEALAEFPDLAEGYDLLAEILAAGGDEAGATGAAERAQALREAAPDPETP